MRTMMSAAIGPKLTFVSEAFAAVQLHHTSR
jgi:hypothetical protein